MILSKTKFFQTGFSALNFAPSLKQGLYHERQSFELSNALPEILIISFLHRENRTFVRAFFQEKSLNFTKSVNQNANDWANLKT